MTEEDGSKLLMDLYISHKVVSGANKPGLAKWQSAVLNEVERPEVYEGMDKPYYYDPTTRKLYDNDGDEIPFEIITDASVSPCIGKATTPLSSPSSHTTPESESEESEQPKKPRYTLVPGLFKPTPEYPAFQSTTGVVAIGDGKFRCRFRKTPNGCLNTGSYTEEAFRAQFDLNSIAKLEKEKAHPTILQKLPAAAANPIASPEPHAKITKIEAHEQDPHKFTVWYGVEDRRKLKMSIVVTSTDGNIDLPVIVGSVWHDDSREKFREFWTQHQSVEKKNSNIPEFPEQAEKPDVIDLCESDGEEDPQKPLASPLHDPRAAAKSPASPAIHAADGLVDKHAGRSGRDRSTGLSRCGLWNILNVQPTQHNVIQPGDSTSNNDIGQSPELDEPSKCTTNPNNFGPDPADGSPKHYGLSLDSKQVLHAFGRDGRFKVITCPDLVNDDYSNGTPISSIRVFIRVSDDEDGKTRLLTFGTIRRMNKDGLADFFKHWLTKNCCKELVDAYWALSEHVDSDIEDQSTRSGYYGDIDETRSPLAESFSAQPGILRENNETGRSPGGSPTTPRCPSDKALDYMLDNAFKAAEQCNVGAINALNTIAIEARLKPIYPTHKFDFGTPTELPRQEVGDMSSEQLQERRDAVEKNKDLLQRALHESEEEAARLKEEVDERNVKQEAATTIQAVVLMQMACMQYQKTLPVWNEMQAAMRLVRQKNREAQEADRIAKEADLEAKRKKRAAEEAKLDAKRKLSEFQRA